VNFERNLKSPKMAFQLVKTGTTDAISTGDGTDPWSISGVTLNQSGTPATIDSSPVQAELLAQTYLYSGISMQLISEAAGIDYKLSLDNTNWFDALTSGAGGDAAGEIADMDATGSDVRKTVYMKVVVANDGSVTAGTKTAPDIRITRTENQ
jgi:hypothetical protein